MSWKASAYVKELTNGLNHTEKLVLFVLADYHNTAKKIAWPAMPILATEALMSERNLTRVLSNLEEKGLIKRLRDSGGHCTTLYCFPALDQGSQFVTPEIDLGLTNDDARVDIRADKSALQGRQNPHANKERTGEPVNTTGEPVRAEMNSDNKCKKHPNSGLTNWGSCWGCYSERCSGRIHTSEKTARKFQ